MTRMTSTRRFNASFPAVSHALADELLGMLGFRHFLNMSFGFPEACRGEAHDIVRELTWISKSE